ncbi:MAG: acyl-CoA reductase [Bacteroidetes bacterium]|nr:MAG: acyl-CoA reductase [Bacteroidota bacterium]
MIEQSTVIQTLISLGDSFSKENEALNGAVNRSYLENSWLTKENYWTALEEWKEKLNEEALQNFSSNYTYSIEPRTVGIIMAGNIPMVGFHDLLCVLLSGNKAAIKPSSDDKVVMTYIVNFLSNSPLSDVVTLVERLDKIDAVIATGSNNSYRYFERYFSHIPNVLRKNRKSIAILDGSESIQDLDLLADDVFQYFGLGCRNVSFIYLPKSMNITTVLDQFMKYKDLANHNKYANNYTYHRALLLMNSEQHLDTGFSLPKERLDLNAPLACIHYAYYDDKSEVDDFIKKNEENLQCIVGNYWTKDTISFGMAQNPDLQDFADKVDTMQFLDDLRS